MTKTIRTAADILKSVEFLDECILNTENFLRDLRALPHRTDIHVIGYPKYGLYLSPRNEVSALTSASLFSAFDAARVATVRNGKGEVAQIVTLAHARAKAISQQEDSVTTFWACRREAAEDLDIARQIEADEAECARLDAMADEGDYYDQFACWYGDDDHYDQRRDERAEREADARQDR